MIEINLMNDVCDVYENEVDDPNDVCDVWRN